MDEQQIDKIGTYKKKISEQEQALDELHTDKRVLEQKLGEIAEAMQTDYRELAELQSDQSEYVQTHRAAQAFQKFLRDQNNELEDAISDGKKQIRRDMDVLESEKKVQ